MKPVALTQEKLKELLKYDPDTGIFTWLTRRGGWANEGSNAGYINKQGYRKIVINKKLYCSHRLTWLYITGSFPKNQIDHIYEDKSDNRFCNLREATKSQNMINQGVRKNNTTGKKGVTKKGNKYKVEAQVNKKRYYLGVYSKLDKAGEVYQKFARKHHNEFYNNR